MKRQYHSSCRGFSLVELLIVAAVLGLIVAMAMPNLLNAIQKARQSRTIADQNAIAKGCAMYQQDFAHFPIAPEDSDAIVIKPFLVPYTENFGGTDGWNRAFGYSSTDGESYTLASYGLGGEKDASWPGGTTSYFVDDIVMVDGAFHQVPDGPQQ